MKVLVLGAGKMIEAILTGLAESEDLSDWGIYSPGGQSSKDLAMTFGCQHVTDLSLARPSDFVLLGCKPQQLTAAAEQLPDNLRSSLFVSVLAAVSEQDQLKTLRAKRLVRLMPNLAVRGHRGVVLLSSHSGASELSRFQKMFGATGVSLVVKEDELDELTLLTGSGPAFFYELAQRLSESFVSLSPKDRERLAREVLIGAALSASTDDRSFPEMIAAVTSKGGVTIAVLESWRSLGLQSLVKKGIDSGKARLQEIKGSFHQR